MPSVTNNASKNAGPSPRTTAGDTSRPLSGLSVLDLAGGIAAGHCTKLLADAGARVTKIEPTTGDPLRTWSSLGRTQGETTTPDGADSALFRYLNTLKRSIVADPSDPQQRQRLEKMFDVVDVVILDGDDPFGGLHPTSIAESHPSLIVVSISNFGLSGPWAGRPATEFTLQAWSGSMAKRGEPDREPLQAGGLTGYWYAGSHAAVAILAAIRHRRNTGSGELIDISVLEGLIIGYSTYKTLWASLGHSDAADARGLEIPSIEPAADGWVGFCTVLGRMWHDFCNLVGHPEWAEDPTLDRWAGRAARTDELRSAIAQWLKGQKVDDVVETATLLRIASAPVGNGATIPEFEHFREREVFVDNPTGFIQPRPPYRLSDTPPLELSPAPVAGEDGDLGDGTPGWIHPGSASPKVPRITDGPLPLSGLRVADFTTAMAGAYGAQILGMLGAEVIKVESITHADPARKASVLRMDQDLWWEYCPLFLAANTDKQGITLDLARPEGLAAARSLIEHSDVVIENFTPRVMDNFGLDWESVKEINPEAVMVRLPAFGLDGVWRDRPGFAQTQEQVCGMAWVTGYRDGQPMLPRGLCDWLSATQAIFALLIALEQREMTGQGLLVEASMAENGLSVAAEAIVEYSAYGRLLDRQGNWGPEACPQGAYQCAGDDRWIALSVRNDDEWMDLRTALGDPVELRDARFDTTAGRIANREFLDEILSRAFLDEDPATVVDKLWANLPVAIVRGAWELALDPHLRERGFFQSVDHPVAGSHDTYLGLPYPPLSGMKAWSRSGTPLMGEHNHQILTGLLGMDEQTYSRLVEQQVIGSRPIGALAEPQPGSDR